tara:strand:- start:228 stop:422 length:195 start_codon:yes stop_codon:yes gene_type:complete
MKSLPEQKRDETVVSVFRKKAFRCLKVFERDDVTEQHVMDAAYEYARAGDDDALWRLDQVAPMS